MSIEIKDTSKNTCHFPYQNICLINSTCKVPYANSALAKNILKIEYSLMTRAKFNTGNRGLIDSTCKYHIKIED